nr:MAG TPA: MAEBL protein [Caudoviricetes sp.]
MAEAKINITAEAHDEGLKKLNTALAEGQQSVKAMQKELKDLEKATASGTKATDEQASAMRRLQQSINEQKQVNSQYNKSINDTLKGFNSISKGADTAGSSVGTLAAKFLEGTGSAGGFSTALTALTGGMAGLATAIIGGVVVALGAMTVGFASAGADAQQTVAHFGAMKNSVDDAVTSYRIFNDLTRDSTFDPGQLEQMQNQLMGLGYSAANAADLIRLCGDAAAGLGKGATEAQQMVDAISRLQATGEVSSRQLIAMKTAGMNLDKAFASLGMTGDEAMQAVEDGTMDSQTAIQALTGYMHEFDGSMAKSKQNIIDQWGDITGNLSACCAEIGLGIMEAFDQSEIIQLLIDFTEDLLSMVRDNGVSIFSDFGEVASYALSLIGDVLEIIINAVKVAIILFHKLYEGCCEIGVKIADALSPILSPLAQIWNILSKILHGLGQKISVGIDDGWAATFGTGAQTEGSRENHFVGTQRKSTGRAGGGGGGGGSKAGGSSKPSQAEREEERRIDALIKKYTDADKQKQALAKSTLELAKANVNMLVGEQKKQEENRISLQALSDAHSQLMKGWENELEIAKRINDEETRKDVIKAINDQVTAENRLYEAKVKAQQFQFNLKENQEDTKNLIDQILGTEDEAKRKIDKIKETLQESLQDIDVAVANPDEGEQLNNMAKLLQMTPDALAEELALKGQTLAEFAEQYKTTLAEASQAEIQQLSVADQWAKKTQEYCTQVGQSMGSAMADFIKGNKSASQALADFVRGLINNAVSILSEWLGVFAIYSAFPTLASGMTPADMANKTVFGIQKHATGGYITGSGTGTSDSIPAMLSNGEYVLRSSAVDRIGIGTLNAMNAGAVPQFSEGGSVGDVVSGGNHSVNMSVSAVDSSSFMEFLKNGGMDSIKQILFDENRDFTAEAGVW